MSAALQDIPVDRLVPHPENSNHMSAEMLTKLRRHIERTGRYDRQATYEFGSPPETTGSGGLTATLTATRTGRKMRSRGSQSYVYSLVWGLTRRDILLDWLRKRPDVALSLLQVVSQRLRRTTELLSDASSPDVQGRLAKKLLQLAHSADEELVVERSQEDLAVLVGATRVMVNKTLRRFGSQGFVSLRPKRIQIHRPEKRENLVTSF